MRSLRGGLTSSLLLADLGAQKERGAGRWPPPSCYSRREESHFCGGGAEHPPYPQRPGGSPTAQFSTPASLPAARDTRVHISRVTTFAEGIDIFFKISLIFREGEGRDKGGEKHQSVVSPMRLTNWGPNPQPGQWALIGNRTSYLSLGEPH